jgi:hypothetical protein
MIIHAQSAVVTLEEIGKQLSLTQKADMLDPRRIRLKVGLAQLSDDQLQLLLATDQMILDEYYYDDGLY